MTYRYYTDEQREYIERVITDNADDIRRLRKSWPYMRFKTFIGEVIAKYIPYRLEHEWDLHYYRSTADETKRALAIIGVCN